MVKLQFTLATIILFGLPGRNETGRYVLVVGYMA